MFKIMFTNFPYFLPLSMSTLVLKSSKRRKLFPKQARDASLSAFEALLWIFYVVCNKRCFVVCFITLQIRHEMFRFLINRLLNGETLDEETMAVEIL